MTNSLRVLPVQLKRIVVPSPRTIAPPDEALFPPPPPLTFKEPGDPSHQGPADVE
jgi:hypothetical protein